MAVFSHLLASFLVFGALFLVAHIPFLRRLAARPPVVKANNKDRTIYTIENGERHPIPDWNTFVTLGYDVNDIRGMDPAELEKIPLGDPVGQIFEEKKVENPMAKCPCVSQSSYEESLNVEAANARVHIICIIENAAALEVLPKHSAGAHQRFVSEEDVQKYIFDFTNSSKPTPNPTLDECQAIFNITHQSHLQKYRCPELCVPRPLVEVPLSYLLPRAAEASGELHADTTLTCSMTYQELARMETLPTGKTEHVNHMLRLISHRRVQECFEHDYWRAQGGHAVAHETPPRRKVHGLIIWVGSRTRMHLVESQIEVLAAQNHLPKDAIIAGWMATEDEYDCRVGTTLCEDATSTNAYYKMMPTTRLNVASAGWACAQRRPLRAIAHTLMLYDPNYLLVVDDDTYVNTHLLAPSTPLDNYIRSTVMTSNVTFGSLTHGKKITKKGFYYGGAGYLIGKLVVDQLNGHEIGGPLQFQDNYKDPMQMKHLSLFHQVLPLSEAHCSDCVVLQGSAPYNENGQGQVAKTKVRLIDLCLNVMSQEHTCYHSDHAISRCYLHGANTDPVDVACGGGVFGEEKAYFGMCMGTDNCAPAHLTCHRWYPSPGNVTVPKNMYA